MGPILDLDQNLYFKNVSWSFIYTEYIKQLSSTFVPGFTALRLTSVTRIKSWRLNGATWGQKHKFPAWLGSVSSVQSNSVQLNLIQEILLASAMCWAFVLPLTCLVYTDSFLTFCVSEVNKGLVW